MSLEEAIDKTKLFYKNNKRYAVSRTTEDPAAYTSIGYGTANGAAKRALSTLLQFGLLEKLPGGDDSKVKISELGFKIAAYDDDPEREALIMEAAQRPKVFKELLAEFPDGLPASDPPIRTYLLAHDFNLDAVLPLIRDFRATVAFAKIYERGKMEEQEREDELEDLEDELDSRLEEIDRRREAEREARLRKEEEERRRAATMGGGTLEATKDMVDMSVPLGIGRKMVLYFPKDATADDFAFFNAFWDGYQKRLNLTDEPLVRTGNALWRTNDTDLPVVVKGYLGKQNGRHYVSVEGSGSGVPLDELVYDE